MSHYTYSQRPEQAKAAPGKQQHVIPTDQINAIRQLPDVLPTISAHTTQLTTLAEQMTQILSSMSELKHLLSHHQKEIYASAAKIEALASKVETLANDTGIRIDVLQNGFSTAISQKLDLSARIANARDRNVPPKQFEIVKIKKKDK